MYHRNILQLIDATLALPLPAGALVFNDGAVPQIQDHVIQAHRDRQAAITAQSQAILDGAEADGHRDLSTEEQRQLTDLGDEFDGLEGQIGVRTRVLAQAGHLRTPQGRRTTPDPVVNQGDEPADPAEPRRPTNAAPQRPANQRVYPEALKPTVGNGGFRNFGDFARAVKNANPRFGGELDGRLVRNASASTYMQEGVGADGGFAVPADFRSEIMGRVFGEDKLLSRTDRQVTSSNSVTMPVDMSTPWQATGGIRSYWVGEAQAKTQSKMQLEQVTVKAHQLATLVPVTEELLEDAPALDGYLRRKVPEYMDFTVSMALVWGDGAGKPLGFMNAPVLVTQAAESGQTADTLVPANLVKMLARMPVTSRGTAVWLIHPDAEPQLPLMTLGNQPVYLPPNGLAGNGLGTLLGRPVIPHQVCSTVGDLGDLMLADFNQYMSLLKTGGGRDANGMRTDVSIHLWFDQDLVAYRFTVRLGGMPWWSAPVSMRSGTNTLSPFVTLAAR